MRINRNKYRALYAALVLIAFFIPAYSNVSAFQFLFLAVGSITGESEITLLDLAVVLIPLLLVPLGAALILIRSVKKKPLNSLLLGLPFFSIAFFFLILSFDVNRQVNNTNAFGLLKQMSIGFYIAASASLFLLFSYSRREALNLNS